MQGREDAVGLALLRMLHRAEGSVGLCCVPYLMGLNMAFPKSWNLSTSFRCTPLGFTTWGGNGVLVPGKPPR